MLANDLMVDLDHELSGPQTAGGPLLKFSRAGLPRPEASPPLGRDTDAYMRAAGYSDREIATLRQDGIVA